MLKPGEFELWAGTVLIGIGLIALFFSAHDLMLAFQGISAFVLGYFWIGLSENIKEESLSSKRR